MTQTTTGSTCLAETASRRRAPLLSRRQVVAGSACCVPIAAILQSSPTLALQPTGASSDLVTFMRLFAVTEGQCALTNAGIIYGKKPGQMPVPLVGYLSVLQVEITQPAPGLFRAAQLEAMVCTTIDGQSLLGLWRNPISDEWVRPVGYASPENLYYFDATGTYPNTPPDGRRGGTSRAIAWLDNEVSATEVRENSFPSGITEAEFPRAYAGPLRRSMDILTHRTSVQQISTTAPFVSTVNTMLTDAPWPLWMMMGKADGHVIWHGFGSKYRSLQDIPSKQRQLIDAAYDGFLSNPSSFPRAEWNSVAQLKRAWNVR
ncbi:MAG: DUF1838 family protein [Blastomonas fulva]